MGGLPVSNLVNVSVNLTPQGALGLSFGVLMIAGDSNVINGAQRFRSYSNIAEVAADFGTTAPEYLAAALYFSQSPQPSTSPFPLMVGRWFSAASAALNVGGILSASQQVLANWSNISNGGLDIVIDGTAQNLTGLNFTSVTNLNGVASVITAALSAGATCVWTGTNFEIISGTTGIGINATGTFTVAATGTNGDTIHVDGTLVTLVTGSPTGNQVLIGSTATQTAANLQLFLQNSTDVNITKATYARVGTVITATYLTPGTAGNAFTLATSSTDIVVSAGTLTGGTNASSVGYATLGAGTDISAQLLLTASTSQALAAGFAAESPVQCVSVLANLSPLWYGLMFSATGSISSSQSLAVSSFIEAQQITRVHGVTTSDTNSLSSLSTTDLAYLMQQAGYNQSFIQYSSTTPHAVASMFGRAFSVDFEGSDTTITLMFKQEPGVTGENLTSAQASALQAKNCNVFVDYVNSTVILQYGTMSSGQFFDTIQGIDWLQNAIQTAVYNVLFTSTTKIPQTDAGVNQLTNAIAQVCGQAVSNGLVAGGVWNAPGFGSLEEGQYLKAGYYIFATPLALQSESDRAARKAPPIQVAVKLAGAIQSVNVLVSVNQ